MRLKLRYTSGRRDVPALGIWCRSIGWICSEQEKEAHNWFVVADWSKCGPILNVTGLS
jgi:hypothetical protein